MKMTEFWIVALDHDHAAGASGRQAQKPASPYSLVGFTEKQAMERANHERRGTVWTEVVAAGPICIGSSESPPRENILHLPEGSKWDGSVLWVNAYDEPIGGNSGPFSSAPATSIHSSQAAAEKEARGRRLASYSIVGRAKIILRSDGA